MRRSILVISTIFAVLALAGCARLAERAEERFIEGLLENSTGRNGDNVDVDLSDEGVTIENDEGESMEVDYSGNAEWPADMPDSIPKLDADIASVINVGGGWMITCEGTSESDYDSYLAKLESTGFAMEFNSDSDTGKSITGEIGDLRVVLSYHSEGYLILTVTQQ